MSVTAADFVALKQKVKAEMNRRSGWGPLTEYGTSAYDFTTIPVAGEPILAEQGQKVVDIMLAVEEIKGLSFVHQGDLLPKLEHSFDDSRNLLLNSAMNDRSNFVAWNDTLLNNSLRYYSGSSDLHNFTVWEDDIYQDTITLNQAANIGIAFVRGAYEIDLDSNSYYTLSCWAKCDKPNATLDIGLTYFNTANAWVWRGGSNPQAFNNTTDWQKFTLTFKPDNDTQFICYCFTVVGVADGTNTFTIRQCKLEKGSTATEWSKAPEDLGYVFLEDKLKQWESETTTGGASSCRGACTGLCTSTCSGTCTGCSGCSGTCSTACSSGCGSGCTGGCGSGCTGGCSGCSSCYGNCSGGCTGCSSGCSGSCWSCSSECVGQCTTRCTGCNQSCQGGCRTSCEGRCKSSCSSKCYSGCNGCVSCTNTCQGNCGNNYCKTSCTVYCAGCSNSCDSGCGGTCLGCASCTNWCTGCSGCSGGCTAGCDNVCSGTCSGQCSTGCTGCSGCTNSCSSNCTGTCYGSCQLQCYGSCTGMVTSVSTV